MSELTLRKETCQDRIDVLRLETMHQQHKTQRHLTYAKRAKHIIEMQKTEKWNQQMLPIQCGIIQSKKITLQNQDGSDSDEDLIDPQYDHVRTFTTQNDINRFFGLPVSTITKMHVQNLQAIQKTTVDNYSTLRGLDAVFEWHLENETRLFKEIMMAQKCVVIYLLDDVTREATEDERREHRRQIRRLRKAQKESEEAEKDSRDEVEREHFQLESGEAPSKKQKTEDVLDLNDY